MKRGGHARGWRLTEEVQFFVGLQGFLSGEGEVKPAGATQVELHGPAENLNVRWSPFNGLGPDLDPHACHHHSAVVVADLDGETTGLEGDRHKSDNKFFRVNL